MDEESIKRLLAPLRKRIDALDDVIVTAIRDRQAIARDIISLKVQHQLEITDAVREQAILERLHERTPNLEQELLKEIYGAMFQSSKNVIVGMTAENRPANSSPDIVPQDGYREVLWSKPSPATTNLFALLTHNISLIRKTVNFPEIGVQVAAYTSRQAFADSTDVVFELANDTSEDGSIFFLDADERAYGAAGIPHPLPGTHLGVYDQNARSAFVVGGGFGLYKSVVVGLASIIGARRRYHAAHASCCSVNGTGIMMTGGHRAGKTTSLLHLLHARSPNDEIKVLTDDWLLLQEETGRAYALDKTISFSQSFCDEFPHLGLSGDFAGFEARGLKKVYARPDEIYGVGTSIRSLGVDTVVLLLPERRKTLLKDVSVPTAVENIMANTYHMPDCEDEVEEHRRTFWNEFLAKRRILSFDTRHLSSPEESYYQLYAALKGD